MPIKSDLSGLKILTENAKKMHETSEVKLTDIMAPEFIKNCSQFESLEHLFYSSGFRIESKEDFAAIPDNEWEEFIVNNTTFNSWEDMQKQAMTAYVKKQLFKGI